MNQLLIKNFSLDSLQKSKLLVGGFIFFLIISAYTIAQELKYSVFAMIVGIEYIPIAKIMTFVILLPAILLDAWLVDRFKRHQLLMAYTFFFGVCGLIFSFFLTHNIIGIENTQISKYRIFGWLFLIYQEGYSPFLLGIFWSFMNSINSPADAAKTYGFTVSCSKIGGLLVALSAYFFLTNNAEIVSYIKPNTKITLLLILASLALLLVPIFLNAMMKKLDSKVFTGFNTNIKKEKVKKTGIWIGFQLLLKNRYVLGIFLMIFLGDTLVEVMNYQRILTIIKDSTSGNSIHNLANMAAKMYLQISYMHALGLIISFFLTNSIMRFIGTRFSVFITPVLASFFLLTYFITGFDFLFAWLYIILKAMAYTINTPIRESLYIITSKDIQFKAKFTVDAIGLKLARSSGHLFNHFNTTTISKLYGATGNALASNIFFSSLLVTWLVSTYFVSSMYHKVIKENKVISG